MEYTPPLQYRIRQSLRRFASLSLLTAGLMILVRLFEIISFSLADVAPAGSNIELMYGIRFDLLLALRLSAFLLIPFLLIDHFSPRMARIFFSVISVIVVTAEIILILYFSTTRIPLGSDIFSYSMNEILQTVRNSVEHNFTLILPVLFFLTLSVYAFYKWSWFEVSRPVIVILLFFMAGSLLSLLNNKQDVEEYSNELTRNIASNKLNTFCESLFNYYW